MTKNPFHPASLLLLLAGAALLIATGCTTDDTSDHRRYRDRPTIYGQASIGFEDDYDYYPGYEVYYSRNRREYVYRDGSRWVRSPEPRGVTVNVLLAAPSVRMDFRDSPELHNDSVVRTYPRNWHRPDSNQVNRPDNREDKKVDKRDDKQDKKDAKKKNKKDGKDDDDDRKDERH